MAAVILFYIVESLENSWVVSEQLIEKVMIKLEGKYNIQIQLRIE